MEKITIGLFNDSFYPMTDGVIMVIDNYARRLCKIANVIVFVPGYLGKEYDDSKFPYEVVRCNSISFPHFDYSLPIPRIDIKFRQIVEQYKLDIVHIHSPFSMGLEGYLYAKKHHIPCIATMHSQFKQDFEKYLTFDKSAEILNDLLVIKLFDKCDECYAVNSEISRIFYEEYHCNEKPKVMNNATDMVPVDRKSARKEIAKLYNIKDDDKIFSFVGRLNTLKNILFIVDALKIVKDNGFNIKMLFIGSGEDEYKLREKIKETGLENDAILCGKIMDRVLLAKHYAASDLFLFPSKYDASSLVQIEAASQMTPTVFINGSATSATATDN